VIPVQAPSDRRGIGHTLVQIHGLGRKVGEQRAKSSTGRFRRRYINEWISMGSAGRTWMLTMGTERVREGIVISPRGRIGTATAAAFATALSAARAESARVVVDLSGVDYISGEGVAALRDGLGREGAPGVLCGLREPVRITLQLAGLLDELEVEPTRAAAVASLLVSGSGVSPTREPPPRSS
jgi:anti-anti-sigma factor